VLDDARDDGGGAIGSPEDLPQLLAEVEIERRHRPRCVRGLHRLDDQFPRRLGQRREDPAAVEPAHAAGEDGVPIEVTGLQAGRGFVRPVIKDDGRAHSETAIAVDRRHVRARDAVVREPLVEPGDPHGAHALGDQIPDRVIDYRGDHARLQPETVGEIRRAIELASADVDRAPGGLAERDHAGVEAMHQGTKRDEVVRALRCNRQACVHEDLVMHNARCRMHNAAA
jgi:hypothetical protein